MEKYAKKVNPYEKKKKRKLKITRKQWSAIIALLSVIVLIAGIVVATKLGGNSDEHYEGDGHNHSHDAGSSDDGHSDDDGHNHNSTATSSDKVKYETYTNKDGTYRLVIRNNKNEIVFEKDKLTKKPLNEAMNQNKGVYELSWSTGSGANEYECVYYSTKTGQVSQLFVAPRGCDGTRIAYGSEDQKKVIVQDLFNEKTYYKEYELKNAVEKNGNIIVGGRLQDNKKAVIVAYNSTETANDTIIINLYE